MSFSIDGTVHANGSSNSFPVTLTTSNGNDLICVVITTNGGPVTGVTSSHLTFSLRARGGSANQTIEFWYAVASSALTSEVITVATTTSTFITVDAFGVSGVDTSTKFDSNGVLPVQNTGTSQSSISTTASTTFALGAYRVATASPTQGSGWTLISGANFQLVEYQIFSSPQSGTGVTIGTGAGQENGGIADAFVPLTAILVNLTGVAGTGQAGTLSNVSASFSLSGVNATGQAGALKESLAANLVGVAGISEVGTLFPVQDIVNMPITTILNNKPIPVTGSIATTQVPNVGLISSQVALDSILNTNPIPMTGTMMNAPVPGEGSVP